MLELAQQIEGFAGYYCDNADLVVGLAGPPDPIRDALAVDLVRATGVAYTCYDRAFLMKVPQVVIARKQHSFLQLRAWRDTIVADFFATEGAHGIGINYKNNRLKMKVEPANRAAVEAFAASRQLPTDAFMIVETTRPVPKYACNSGTNGPYLQYNCFNPLPAGVEISTPFDCSMGSQGDCTVTAATDRYTYWYWLRSATKRTSASIPWGLRRYASTVAAHTTTSSFSCHFR